MLLLQPLPVPPGATVPERLADPFQNRPEPLALLAKAALEQRLQQDPALHAALHQPAGGKMFGVLVTRDAHGALGYLAGFSGLLQGQWQQPGFVPPVFEVAAMTRLLDGGEAALAAAANDIMSLEHHPDYRHAVQQLQTLRAAADTSLAALRQSLRQAKAARHRQRAVLADDAAGALLRRELALASQADKRRRKAASAAWRERIAAAEQAFEQRWQQPLSALQQARRQLSQRLHRQVFAAYRLLDGNGQQRPLRELFGDELPPAGSGDCAAPKLFHFANRHGYRPLACTEFWYGAAPHTGLRRSGHCYPPCRGRCGVVLPFLLQGHQIAPASAADPWVAPTVVYEDAYIIVLDKPSGILSVPGKGAQRSVLDWLQQRLPHADGPLLVHRLDQATSGLLLAAKTATMHRHLQRQFTARRVEKTYAALLQHPIADGEQRIDLPLRVDLDDRPRQMVCYRHGKAALTRVEKIADEARGCRVRFYPHTGRTHQLRVHAAHPAGLNSPIVGDTLYGTPAARLMLHAERLAFSHPASGRRMAFTLDTPF